MEDGLTLIEMCQQFEDAEQATADARKLAERDRDYYDEKQRTAEEKAELARRNQPDNINNRIKRKINAMMGLEKQTRKDPKAFPRNPDDEDAAKAATDAIRYVCDDSRWDDKRSQCAKELGIEGTAAVMIGVRKSKQGIDPTITRIAWDRFYYDPHSSEFDFADASFMGQVIWMDLDEGLVKYPNAKEALTATWSGAADSDTYDDKPKHAMWADHKRRRVRICEHYYLDKGKWSFCIFTKGGFIVEPQDSPYHGEDGEPECPIKAVSLYVDRENNRYGEVRTLIGPQDMINKTESKFVALISQRQVRVSPNVSTDPNVVRKELARPDGVFVGENGDVEILPTNDMASANFQLNQSAKAEIDLLGPNAALGGKNEQALSGRAVLAQQQGGMTEMATYLDAIKTLSLAVYRSVWCRVRQFWKEERWVRVTDSEQNLRFVGINRPVTAMQMVAKQLGVTKDNAQALEMAAQQGDQQAMQVLQQLQAFSQDPRAQQVMGVENNVNELDVDINVDEGLDTPTIQAEQFETIVKMLPALGPVGQSPEVIKMMIQASQLRDKQKLLEMFEPKAGQQQAPSPEQIMAAEKEAAMQQAQLEGEVEIKKAKIKSATDIQIAEIKTGADQEIKHKQIAVDSAMEAERYRAEETAKAQVDEETGKAGERKSAVARDEAFVDMVQQLAVTLAEMNRPKTKIPVRDENGFIVAMREVYEQAA